ncbi:hypothetical protein pipiens_006324 [Culex pipiens pipiens]|uniref:Uncharacterized protein n=1 Tax=Culex pipiens pipiens TaxID=38569 RepID=A0ABD1DR39_CULPP
MAEQGDTVSASKLQNLRNQIREICDDEPICSRFRCLSGSPESCPDEDLVKAHRRTYWTKFTTIRRFNLLFDVRSIYTRIRRTPPNVN